MDADNCAEREEETEAMANEAHNPNGLNIRDLREKKEKTECLVESVGRQTKPSRLYSSIHLSIN